MDKKNFDQLVKGVREMKSHMAGKPVRGAMTTEKIKRLQPAGWAIGDAKDFLQLTEEELGAVADAAMAAANRASAAIDDVLTVAEASNKRIAGMEAKADKRRKAR